MCQIKSKGESRLLDVESTRATPRCLWYQRIATPQCQKHRGVSRFQICITAQKFDRIQNFPGKLLLGQGEIVWWKNICLEISRDCPFNPNFKALLFKILIKVPFLNWWIPVQGRAKSELILVNTTYDLRAICAKYSSGSPETKTLT